MKTQYQDHHELGAPLLHVGQDHLVSEVRYIVQNSAVLSRLLWSNGEDSHTFLALAAPNPVRSLLEFGAQLERRGGRPLVWVTYDVGKLDSFQRP